MSERKQNKQSPNFKVTVDSSIVWIDEPYGIEIFFPHPEDDSDEEQTIGCACSCGKQMGMNHYQDFPIGTNIFEIQRWALEKMNYYNE